MAWNYHWRSAPPIKRLERDIDALRTVIIQLRRELGNKQRHVGQLKALLHQRANTIDDQRGKIDQLREQNKRLDAEAERYASMLRDA